MLGDGLYYTWLHRMSFSVVESSETLDDQELGDYKAAKRDGQYNRVRGEPTVSLQDKTTCDQAVKLKAREHNTLRQSYN